MQFTNSKGLFSVTFQYDIENVYLAKDGGETKKESECATFHLKPIKKQRIATCKIRKLQDGNDKIGVLVGIGITAQSPTAPDNKFEARKFALKYALANGKFNAEDRAEIWTQYLKKVKMP